ncbi:InlB B-repeat-containing protein [Enterococcus hulanensis]|uniref:InlB B-repeat-containing protein n=1 Tax=Enterococcus hulanensis TaxID=2559929 RepID=UPI00288EFABC|nr:InlB B-repeat-containing protein [Enterococcus hulanensis]MDT2659532.1 InlB B-repeat-containing protein [Enterococcus hulanensis]
MSKKKRVATSILTIIMILGSFIPNFSMVTAEAAASNNPTVGPGGGGGLFNAQINPSDDNNIVMDTDMSGSFSSIDGGESFVQRNLLGSVKYTFNPHDENTVYAYHEHIYVSHDKGQSYKRLYPPESNVKGLVSGLQEGVEVTLGDPNQAPTHRVMGLTVDPKNENILYYIAKGGYEGNRGKTMKATIQKSVDGGNTWSTVAEFPEGQFTHHRYSINSFEKYMKLYIHPDSPEDEREITLMTSDGIYKVVDNGSGKIETISDITSRTADWYYDEKTKTTTYYLIETDVTKNQSGEEEYKYKELMRSTDCKNWESISKNYSDPDIGNDRELAGVAVNGDKIYMSFSTTNGKYFTLGSGIAVSEDRGQTWTTSLKGWDTGNITGHNWTEFFGDKSSTLGWNSVKTGLTVSKTNPNVAVNTNHGNAYITKDGGKTWKDTNSDFDPDTQYGATRGIDQITSWDVDVDPFDSNHLFMSYSDVGLFESNDGGHSWKRSQNNGIPSQPYYSNSCYSFTFDPDIQGLCFATFSGIHDMNIGTYVRRVILLANASKENANRQYESFTGGVARSTNGGSSWNVSGALGEQPIRDNDGKSGLPDRAVVTDIVIDPNSPKEADKRVVYAACMGYGVYKSEDGGQTWRKFIDGMGDAKQQTPWRLTWTPDYSRLYVAFAPTGGSAPGTYEQQLALLDYHPDEGPVYYLERDAKEWKRIESMPTEGMQPNRKGLDYVAAFNGLSVDSKGNIYGAGRAASVNGDKGKRDYGGGWVSQDDGKTWKMIYPSTANVYDLRVDSRNDNVLYLCNTVGGEVYVSYKGVDTGFDDWIKLDEFQHMVPTRVMEDTRDPSKMYATTFGGGIWHLSLPKPVQTETHKLTYDGNGNDKGSVPTDSASPYEKKSEAVLKDAGDLAKTGKKFVGWNTKADGSGTMYQPKDEMLIVRDTVLYAQWRDSNKQYKLTYDGNGNTKGTTPIDKKSPYDLSSEVTILEPGDLEKKDELFTGWNTKADGSGKEYKAGDKFKIIDDTELYAQWGEGLKVTYDGNGNAEGEPPVDDQNPYQKNSKATVKGSNGMTKPGYVFRGWCTKADYKGAVYKEGDTIDVTADTVLYAYWVKGLAVTYDGNGNDAGTAPVDEKAPYGIGDQITIQDYADLYKKGHVFKEWNSKPDGSGTSYKSNVATQIKEDLTLYAQWKKVEPNGTDVTVLYRRNTDEQGTAPVDEKSPYKHGDEATILDCADMSKDGYAFVGWTNRLEAGGKLYKPGQKITLTANIIFYPQWKEDGSVGGDPEGEKRTLTYDGNGNTGGKAPIDEKSPYNNNASVKILEAGSLEKAGYSFNGWNSQKDGKGTSYSVGGTFRIKEDTVLYAQWKEIPVETTECTIVYRNTNATGGTIPVDDKSPYLKNSVVEIMEPNTLVREGYKFIGWTNRMESAGRIYKPGEKITITGNMIMWPAWEAITEESFTVDFDTQGGSTVASQTIEKDQKVSKPSDPTKAGYDFTGWYKDKDCKEVFDFDTEVITEATTIYAGWKAKEKFDVTFETDGGSSVAKQTVEDGSKASKPSDPTKAGYDFTGWYKDKDCKEAFDFDKEVITKATTIYAGWKAKEKFDVTFETDGGSAVAKQTVEDGAKASKPSNPTKAGYDFTGWYKDKDCKEAFDFDKEVITEATTIYAGWKAKEKFDVTFETDGGSTIAKQTIEDGSKATKPSNPTKSGYDFTGWYKDKDCKEVFDFDKEVITEATTIYAGWKAKEKFAVTFETDGGSAVSKQTVEDGAKASKPSDPTKAGYDFTGWYKDKACKEGFDFDKEVITEATTIYAGWKAKEKFAVTFETDGGSAVSKQTVEDGAKASKPSNPTKAGYDFTGWYKDAGCTEVFDFDKEVITEATTIYAGWKAKEKFDVTFETDGGSTIAKQTIEDGAKATKPSDPTKAGYDFTGWYKDKACKEGFDFDKEVITEATTIYAGWKAKEKFAVTFETDGGSAVSKQTVEDGAKASKPSNPTKAGYDFTGWYKDKDCKEVFDFDKEVITKATTIYAGWKAKAKEKFDVTFETDGGSTIAKQTIEDGAKATKPSDPTKAGYDFTGWYKDKDCKEEFDFDTEVITKATTIYAGWKAKAKEKFDVTFETDGGSAVSKQTVEDGAKATKPSNPTKAGYDFTGWYKDKDCKEVFDFDKEVITKATTIYAGWKAKAKEKFDVTFETDGGSTIAKQTIEDGAKATKPSDPTKAGYDFTGWYKDKDCKEEFDFDTEVITKATTIYAGWKAKAKEKFDVTFETDGGSSVAKQTIEDGAKATKPSDPTKAGYDFTGWYKDKDCKEAFDFDTEVITKATTIYAGWKAKAKEKFDVTFETDGGSSVAKQTIEDGAKATKPSDPTKAGYDFTGWYKDKDCKEAFDFDTEVITEATTIYAGWKAKAKEKFDVTFETDGGSAVSKQTIEDGSKASKPSDPTKAGYDFTGWYKDKDCKEAFDFDTEVITEATTIYAGWKAKAKEKFDVTFETDGGSTIAKQTVEDGSKATKPSDPTKAGYDFTGWYKDKACKEVFDFDTEVITEATTIYAGWKAKEKFDVTFETDGGSAVAKQTVEDGSKASKPSDPTKVGHDFTGWYKDAGCTEVFDFDKEVITEATTIYAGWKAKAKEKFDVTFETDGGSAVAKQTVEDGSKASKPSDPTKAGYDFTGWYKDTGCTEAFDFDTEVITEATTIYAGWEVKAKEKFDVVFDSNGGSAVTKQTIEDGGKATKPSDPTKAGYIFEGWYKEQTFLTPFDFTNETITENVTLYAKWKQEDITIPSHQVTFELDNGDAPIKQEVQDGEKLTRPQDPTKSGYKFAGWYKDSQHTQVFDFDKETISSSLSLYAKWEKLEEYKVIFDTAGGDPLNDQLVLEGDCAVAPADPTRPGYVFVGWYKDANCLEEFDFTKEISEDTIIYALWEQETYQVDYQTNGGDEIASEIVNSSETFTKPQDPSRTGYTFAGWYTDKDLTKAYDFNTPATGNLVLYAKWEKTVEANYTVTYEVNGGSKVDSETVKKDELFTKPKDPSRTGYTFAGWYTDKDLTKAYDFNTPATGNLVLYAKWEQAVETNYTVTYEVNGGSKVDSETVKKDALFTKPQDPSRTGYTFAGWYTDKDLTKAYDFNTPATGNLVLYAKWEQAVETEYTVTYEVNGGSEVASETVKKDALFTKPQDPSRTGYTFAGWYTDKELTQAYDFATPATSDITLYAKWEKNGATTGNNYSGGSTGFFGGNQSNFGSASKQKSLPETGSVQSPYLLFTGFVFVGLAALAVLKRKKMK